MLHTRFLGCYGFDGFPQKLINGSLDPLTFRGYPKTDLQQMDVSLIIDYGTVRFVILRAKSLSEGFLSQMKSSASSVEKVLGEASSHKRTFGSLSFVQIFGDPPFSCVFSTEPVPYEIRQSRSHTLTSVHKRYHYTESLFDLLLRSLE